MNNFMPTNLASYGMDRYNLARLTQKKIKNLKKRHENLLCPEQYLITMSYKWV